MNHTLPHLALKNIDVMHSYLQARLKQIEEVSDLVPFIKYLLPVHTLKHQLSSLLHAQHMKHVNSNKRKKHAQGNNHQIRSLFISLCTLTGIPSDSVHAKIISFLPSSEYRKLPILCTHFRNIMRDYPSIYNEAQYSVNIYLKLNPRERMNENKIYFNLNHKEKLFEIGAKIDIDDDIMHINNEENKQNETSKISMDFPFDKINIWVFGTKSLQLSLPSYTTYKPVCIPFNRFLLKRVVLKSVHCIQSVQFMSIGRKIEKDFKDLHLVLDHCIVARISNSLILPSLFTNLQYLELWNPKFYQHSEIETLAQQLYDENAFDLEVPINIQYSSSQTLAYYESIAHSNITAKVINEILNNVRQTLRGFAFKSSISILRQLTDIDARKCCGVIEMPPNIEWISIKGSDYVVNLEHCRHIIGMQLSMDIRYSSIIWPSESYVIPYLYLCPMEQSLALRNVRTVWKERILNGTANEMHSEMEYKTDMDRQQPPVKFVCFGKFAVNDAASTVGFSWASNISGWSAGGNRDVVYDEDLREEADNEMESIQVERVKIKDVMANKFVYRNAMCLVLDKSEINHDLFAKVMNYAFAGNQDVIACKNVMYQKWVRLHAAHWIYSIGNLNTLERFS